MKKPNLKDYDFLWLVNSQSYLVTSIILTKEYQSRDFIMIGDNQGVKTYVGKKQRERLADEGWRFFQKSFANYQIKVKNKLKEAVPLLRKLQKTKDSSLTDKKFAETFLSFIEFFRSLWRLYFYTEYFFHDRIQKELAAGGGQNKQLLKNVQIMQKIKFKLRSTLNESVFGGKILEQFLQEITARTQRHDLVYLHYREIVDLLKGKLILKINRKNFVLGKFNNWQTLAGKDAKDINRAFKKIILIQDKQKWLQNSFD